VHHVLFLDAVQTSHLIDRCRRIAPPPAAAGRPRALSLDERVTTTLFMLRHGLTQRAMAWLLGVGQATVCRSLAATRALLLAALAPEIGRASDPAAALRRLLDGAGVDDAGRGRPAVVIVDGTLVPVCDRSWDPVNYSGKHRRKGRSVQVLADALGRIIHVGAPQAGRLHDSRAVRESGLLDALLSDPRLLVHGDRGYAGLGLVTPEKAPPGGSLTGLQRAENRQVSGIRNAVERGISRPKTFSVLRHGIRTRRHVQDRVVAETIAVITGLVLLRQDWPTSRL
jgi:hypothetical protein